MFKEVDEEYAETNLRSAGVKRVNSEHSRGWACSLVTQAFAQNKQLKNCTG